MLERDPVQVLENFNSEEEDEEVLPSTLHLKGVQNVPPRRTEPSSKAQQYSPQYTYEDSSDDKNNGGGARLNFSSRKRQTGKNQKVSRNKQLFV